ncbi:hypothetical protein C7401_10878 [Paraburkholderia unamae]|nr:hypothetical protein C7401_10878 [Paraburkholderia unamae]
MFNEPGHDDSGPWQCPYCGTRLNAQLVLCPECGANLVAAASRIAAASNAASGERPGGIAQRLRTHLNGRPGDFDGEYPSIDEERVARRPRVPRLAWAGAAVCIVALGGYAFANRAAWEPRLGVQVVEGSVVGPHGKLASPSARPAAGHGTPPMAALPRQGPPGQTASLQKARPLELAPGSPGSPGFANTRPDVARELASARASLDKNNLWPARRSIMTALAAQPGNAEAQQMRADLVAREQQRDALIGRARECAHARQWACVRQDAGHAANVDASSREAKHLLALASAEHKGGTGKRFPWPWSGQTYAQAGDARARQDTLFGHH